MHMQIQLSLGCSILIWKAQLRNTVTFLIMVAFPTNFPVLCYILWCILLQFFIPRMNGEFSKFQKKEGICELVFDESFFRLSSSNGSTLPHFSCKKQKSKRHLVHILKVSRIYLNNEGIFLHWNNSTHINRYLFAELIVYLAQHHYYLQREGANEPML